MIGVYYMTVVHSNVWKYSTFLEIEDNFMRELDMLSQNSAWPPSDILKHSFWSCSLRLIFLSVLLNRYIFVRMYLLDSRKQNIYCILGKITLCNEIALLFQPGFKNQILLISYDHQYQPTYSTYQTFPVISMLWHLTEYVRIVHKSPFFSNTMHINVNIHTGCPCIC